MTSPPPSPFTVLDPEPVVITLAALEPVMLRPVVSALALRFSKLVTATLSPVVWSVPAATERLTAVVPPEASMISVALPVPPEIALSEP